MMKKRGPNYVMLIMTFVIAVLYFTFIHRYPEHNTVVATIDDKNISLWNLRQFANNMYGFYNPEQNREILKLIINQEVFLYNCEC